MVTEIEAELNPEIPDEDNPSQELDIEDAGSTGKEWALLFYQQH